MPHEEHTLECTLSDSFDLSLLGERDEQREWQNVKACDRLGEAPRHDIHVHRGA